MVGFRLNSPEIKSHILYQQSQPGTLGNMILTKFLKKDLGNYLMFYLIHLLKPLIGSSLF